MALNGWMGGLMRVKKREKYRFATCVLHYSRARLDYEAEQIKRKNVSHSHEHWAFPDK